MGQLDSSRAGTSSGISNLVAILLASSILAVGPSSARAMRSRRAERRRVDCPYRSGGQIGGTGRLVQLGGRRPIWHELACLALPGSVFIQVKPGRPTAALAPVARPGWCSGLARVQRCGRSAVGAKRATADTAVSARQLPPGLASTRRGAVGDGLRRKVPPESTPPVVPEARARDLASQPGRRSGLVVNSSRLLDSLGIWAISAGRISR